MALEVYMGLPSLHEECFPLYLVQVWTHFLGRLLEHVQQQAKFQSVSEALMRPAEQICDPSFNLPPQVTVQSDRIFALSFSFFSSGVSFLG